jgi:hypothetical protein
VISSAPLAPMSAVRTRPRGFAIPGNAAAAAKKGHALGRDYCHEWTPGQAVDAGLKAARVKRFAAAFRRAGSRPS